MIDASKETLLGIEHIWPNWAIHGDLPVGIMFTYGFRHNFHDAVVATLDSVLAFTTTINT